MTILEAVLNFIKVVFPVTFIGLTGISIGYAFGTIVSRRRRKPWEKIIEESHK